MIKATSDSTNFYRIELVELLLYDQHDRADQRSH